MLWFFFAFDRFAYTAYKSANKRARKKKKTACRRAGSFRYFPRGDSGNDDDDDARVDASFAGVSRTLARRSRRAARVYIVRRRGETSEKPSPSGFPVLVSVSRRTRVACTDGVSEMIFFLFEPNSAWSVDETADGRVASEQ